MIEIARISSAGEMAIAHKIRFEVFVDEQRVAPELELDEFEDISNHYLAKFNGTPAGTARWRFTENGVKLERFAVSKEFRNHGIGSALVEFLLKDIFNHLEYENKTIYLHAQVDAMRLYSRFGFQKTGNIFDEAGIRHYKMILEG
ncbi:MAG TPA: GNAT family N-acetyltransferase [Cyclobacteriaceae bacterium]|nr:GNAT family N-acetyltransferase [Cyclobacteriaceae bacterium]